MKQQPFSYDPDNEKGIHESVDEEEDRICFLTGIAEVIATKARIKLNTTKRPKLEDLLHKCIISCT